MLIAIDPSSTTPIYAQLVSELRRLIVDGTVPVSGRLPAAGELAQSLDVNRNTVLRAYRQLREDGLVELRRGRGAIVVAKPVNPSEVEQMLDVLVTLARRHHVDAQTLMRGMKERGLH